MSRPDGQRPRRAPSGRHKDAPWPRSARAPSVWFVPYEFLPLPEPGTKGKGLGRDGKAVCDAVVVSVKTSKAFDKTNLLTMKVPKEYAMKARFFKAEV